MLPVAEGPNLGLIQDSSHSSISHIQFSANFFGSVFEISLEFTHFLLPLPKFPHFKP